MEGSEKLLIINSDPINTGSELLTHLSRMRFPTIIWTSPFERLLVGIVHFIQFQ